MEAVCRGLQMKIVSVRRRFGSGFKMSRRNLKWDLPICTSKLEKRMRNFIFDEFDVNLDFNHDFLDWQFQLIYFTITTSFQWCESTAWLQFICESEWGRDGSLDEQVSSSSASFIVHLLIERLPITSELLQSLWLKSYPQSATQLDWFGKFSSAGLIHQRLSFSGFCFQVKVHGYLTTTFVGTR